MQRLKQLSNPILVLIYFISAQCIGTFALIFYKVKTDASWVDRVYEAISKSGVLSPEYLRIVGELVIPALIIADCLIILPVLAVSHHRGDKLFRPIEPVEIAKLFTIGCALNTVVSIIVDSLPVNATSKYSSLVSLVLVDNVFVAFLTNAVLAALMEEIIFRKLLITKEKNVKIALLTSSLIFGVMHMNPIQSTYAFILGLVLGYIYIKSNYNLLTSFIVHLTINGTSIVYEYLPQIGKSIFLVLGLLSIPLAIKIGRSKI